MTALLVLFVILMFFTLDFLVARLRRRAAAVEAEAALEQIPVSPLAELPDGTLLSPGHVWVRAEPTGSLRLGIDKVLLTLLGGVEFLYAHPEGVPVRLGGPLVMVRNGARALQIRSPIDGVITSVNPEMGSDPSRVADDPFREGWIYELKPDHRQTTMPSMTGGRKAAAWMQDELTRLRDIVVDMTASEPSGVPVLADGGLPLDDLGSHIGSRVPDEEWEKLVSDFFGRGHE
jgi:glycine cleavage system H protein